MIAYLRSNRPAAVDGLGARAASVARALGLFAGRPAASASRGDSFFLQNVASPARGVVSSRAAASLPLIRGASGAAILFTGNIDNSAELDAALGVGVSDPTRLYLAAFERWGDDCDAQVIGDYAAIIETADGGATRLARSPWRGPPLVYAHDADRTMVASVPRALIAGGLPEVLDEAQVIDNLLLNATSEHGWYKNSFRLEIGCSVWLRRDGSRTHRAFYDHLAPRETRLASRADYVAAADALLREAAGKAMAGAKAPGALLSGGLDSANVAVRALDHLPGGKRLPTFTFRPHADFAEPEDGPHFGDDAPFVEALTQQHPRLDPHFARAEGYDENWERMFHAIGCAPFALQNMAIFEPVLAQAKDAGCDVILSSEYGNHTFSNEGAWGFTEYALRGRWVQLARAVAALRPVPRPLPLGMAWHGLTPLLPERAWLRWQALNGRDGRPANQRLANLREDAVAQSGALARAEAAGVLYARTAVASRREWQRRSFARGSYGMGEINQGFEQIYGLRIRDVTAYRPFVEFCLGLPTDLFLHDGTSRWLARELGKGLLPEAQRTNTRYGFHNCDWHERIGPRLGEYTAMMARARTDPLLERLVDFAAVDAAIAEFPAHSTLDRDAVLRFGLGIPRAVLASRFVRHVTGANW